MRTIVTSSCSSYKMIQSLSLLLPSAAQQAVVGSLTVILFLCMAFEKFSPEVLFLTALVIITFFEILTLDEALSGNLREFLFDHTQQFFIENSISNAFCYSRILKQRCNYNRNALSGRSCSRKISCA